LYGSLQQQAIIRARDYDLPVIAARWILWGYVDDKIRIVLIVKTCVLG
jgi:hypothetical protein